MARLTKGKDGKYHVTTKHGHKVYEQLVGSETSISEALKTAGGLKKHLMKTNADVLFRKKLKPQKQKRLQKAGYFTRKGKFGSYKNNFY